MSWHFSQALEAAFLEENSWDGERCARLKLIPFAPDDSASGKMKDTWHRSPFGMMFVPSTESLGAALLTWFLAGFPVRTSPLPEKAPESPERDRGCGRSSRELSVRYDRDTSSWKTVRSCLRPESVGPYSSKWWLLSLGEFGCAKSLLCDHSQTLFESWETLPKWGSMRDGVLSEHTTPVLRTNATESGLWPTPTTQDNIQLKGKDKRGTTLGGAARFWPTPKASAAGPDFAKLDRSSTGISLQTAAAMWPTPCATDHKGAGKNGQLHDRLDYAAERGATKSKTYPTPKTNGFCGGSGAAAKIRQNADLSTEEKRSMLAGNGGQLNPDWVEWLMGWPLGWTDSKPLATAKFRQWFDSHGGC